MDMFPPLFQQWIAQFGLAIGTAPTAASFATVVTGWIVCNGRRTVSAVVRAAGPHAPKSHDAYQNFFSQSCWSIDALWKTLFLLLVQLFALSRRDSTPPRIWIAGDDTLSKHFGRKIWGAGLFRDAVRSSKKRVAYAWGLNWVALAMIVRVPLLRDRFLALPILARLNPKTDEANETPRPKGKKKTKAKGKGSKQKKTTVTIMEDMVRTVAGWLPDAQFLFCGDGAYASLAGRLPANVQLVSRMRCDAALYALPPAKKKKGPGRPPKKGRRLPCPRGMAQLVGKRWKRCRIDLYGELVERDLFAFTALWYEVCSDRPVKIVIVRDPEGQQDDEFFFTTDLAMTPQAIVFCYTGRWAIEVAFRETKQYLGMDHPQARKKRAVLRIAPFCLWLNALIKAWFIAQSRQAQPTMPENDPWYPHKNTISFQDMLGALRLHFWRQTIFARSTSGLNDPKIRSFVAKSLAKVA